MKLYRHRKEKFTVEKLDEKTNPAGTVFVKFGFFDTDPPRPPEWLPENEFIGAYEPWTGAVTAADPVPAAAPAAPKRKAPPRPPEAVLQKVADIVNRETDEMPDHVPAVRHTWKERRPVKRLPAKLAKSFKGRAASLKRRSERVTVKAKECVFDTEEALKDGLNIAEENAREAGVLMAAMEIEIGRIRESMAALRQDAQKLNELMEVFE